MSSMSGAASAPIVYSTSSKRVGADTRGGGGKGGLATPPEFVGNMA